jgi:hypothetical protein
MTNEERTKLLDEVDAEVVRQLDADQLAVLCGSSPAELQAIAPAALDAEKLQSLFAILGDATRSNTVKAQAIRSIAGLSEIAINLAAKLAKA